MKVHLDPPIYDFLCQNTATEEHRHSQSSPPLHPSRYRRALQNAHGLEYQDDSKVLQNIMQQTHPNSLKLRITIYLFSLAYGKGDFNKKLNEIDTIPKITVCAFQTKLLQYKICDLDSLASSKNAARRSNVASVFLKRCLYSLEIITNFCWENLTFFQAATGALLAVYHSGTR